MFGYECASRRCSIPLDCEEACCAGTCDESPGIAGVGEECSNGTNRPCEEGTYCNVWEEPAVCMLYTEVGESCDPMSACAPGAYCSFEDGADEGECRPRAAEGERCTGVAGCDRMDLWCNPGTETCEPALGPGESCEMDRASGCVWYTTCDLEVTDTCVAKPTIGDPCLVGTECGGSLACHEGSCAPKQAQPICER